MTTAKPKILVCDSYPVAIITALESKLGNYLVQSSNRNEILKKTDDQVVGLLVRSATKVDDKICAQLPNLKIVGTATSGFDHIDYDLLKSKGIYAFNTPDANANATADLTMWHILSCIRNLSSWNLSKMNWRPDLGRGLDAMGLNLGILGFGRIGQRVAQRAQAFGLNVFYHDPYLEPEEQLMGQPLGLLELFDHCDIITLHLPLTQKTKNIINDKTLEHFGHDKILINCARGELIRPSEALKALDEGILAALGLDTFPQEPLPMESEFRSHPKIIWTPHIGAFTQNAFEHSCNQAAFVVAEFLLKQQVPDDILPPDVPWAKDL